MYKNPRGRSSVAAIVAIVVYAVITVFVPALSFVVGDILVATLATDNLSCSVNLIWGCSRNTPASGGGQVAVGASCSSPPNSCGQTNLGTIVSTGGGQGGCNASPPPNSSCPAPGITDRGFYAEPAEVAPGEQAMLFWNASNASACKIEGENGLSNTGGASGSVATGALTQSSTFTLTCQNGGGGPETSRSIRVILNPRYREI